jgi:hypothetical protein
MVERELVHERCRGLSRGLIRNWPLLLGVFTRVSGAPVPN